MDIMVIMGFPFRVKLKKHILNSTKTKSLANEKITDQICWSNWLTRCQP